MKWVKFRIKTVTDAEDIIISTLYDLGLEGAQIEDKVPLTAMEKEQMFVDILPDGPEDDGIAYLSFFVEEKEDGSLEVAGEKTTTEAVLADVKQELEDLRQFMDIGEGSVVVDETEDIDWINNWKQYFHQFYIDDILVIPSWENIKPEDTDPSATQVHYPRDGASGRRNRQWYSGNFISDVRRKTCCGNRPGYLCSGSCGTEL